jgi:hypothetical protein
VGYGQHAGEGYSGPLTQMGMIAVFAFCQRSRTGAPSSVANKFAEINNDIFYPGNVLPAGIGAQIVNNINEAALSPEFFGPTTYEFGATIPLPVSPIDGYTYQRSELTYVFDWGVMVACPYYPPNSGDNQRTLLFSAQVDQGTGKIDNTVTTVGPTTYYESVVWRLVPGGSALPYDATTGTNTTVAAVSVIVVAQRSAQQSEVSGSGSASPGGSGSADQTPPASVTVNGV